MFILAGPFLVLVAAVLGRVLGTWLGFATAGVIMGVLAIGVLVAIAWWRGPAAGFAAVLVWILPALMNADVGNGLALLTSGAHITNAHVDDIDSWRGHARVTFGDGMLLEDLFDLKGHTVESGGGSRKQSHFYSCTAMPIVPTGWTRAQPVKLWSLAEEHLMTYPFARQTFHVITNLSADCARAVDGALAKHQLIRDPSPIYLERVNVLSDPDALRLQAFTSAIVPAVVWFLICGLQALARRTPSA